MYFSSDTPLLIHFDDKYFRTEGVRSIPIPMVCLALLEVVWRCAFVGSHGIWSVMVFEGSVWIRSSFVFLSVYRFDPSNLRFSSLAMVVALGHWRP